VVEKVQELQKVKLLFVEDEIALIDIISETLNKLDLNFLIAHNGAQGLELLDEHDDIDVVITDLNMPVMTGIEMIESIRNNEKYKDIDIIIISAHTEKCIVNKVQKLNVSDYLFKPFDFRKFIALISEIKTKKS
jgi:CheY-like chemotaxis protein